MNTARIGDVELISLSDGGIEMPAERVYPEAGDAVEAYRPYLTEAGQVHMAVNCFLVRADGRTVLVDSGMGPRAGGGLLSGLNSAGVKTSDVDFVVFTHLHGDHTGWNIDPESGKARFPNARYLVPRGDWDHYGSADPPPDSFTRDIAPLESLGCLELVEGEHRISASLVTVAMPGHTPGHLGVAVSSGGERGFVAGDVVFTCTDVEEPRWRVVFDGDHEVAVRTRLGVLERLAEERTLVGATHLPAPGLGHFEHSGERFTWRALASPMP
jgi:glyoxylase-like metal-dependent hydrolase (beta-lactamase superfamily II)